MVRVGKVLDPVHHIPLREAIAIVLGYAESENVRIRYLAHASGKSTSEVNSSRERYPVFMPCATVCQEEFGLLRAGGFARYCNVVCTTSEIMVVGYDSIVVAE